ncbi:hypothetical protein NOR_07093 [Metarhizium rileyi]|uniref:Sulfotransferase ppzF n=2 Tax=Metarhizium rileyi (strain RCEF 4871) TaxID=1649241 RepID=PPZF_METRR|nr:RecName: Full=Pyrrolopyrazine biosynthesis cluster protein F [Metarhizium rileyi RCEF 4871]OAA37394.1 hypothetical protein NOR_07093 [Metarhizium rileyi RCEF 4871]TWU70991.1 hypothetical protein ED733_000736 [Metarhizium rileyi]
MSAHPGKPGRYYLISYPRTASNLLLKILALDSQPNFSSGEVDGGYFFMPADDILIEPRIRARSIGDWTADERAQVKESFQACFEAQQQWLEATESQGRSVFVKEHTVFFADPTARSDLQFGPSPTREPAWTVEYAGGSTHSKLNITVLPDEFLLTWLPTFLIRHPALAFPSLYRTVIKREGKESAAADNFASLLTTVEWSRSLYDFYVQNRESLPCSPDQSLEWPMILDADDIIAHPATVALYCNKIGMDPRKLCFHWDQFKSEELSQIEPNQLAMRMSLYQSTGIDTSKSSRGINVDDEASKWRSEFGIAVGDHIEKLVRGAMADYEYLRARRLRADRG